MCLRRQINMERRSAATTSSGNEFQTLITRTFFRCSCYQSRRSSNRSIPNRAQRSSWCKVDYTKPKVHWINLLRHLLHNKLQKSCTTNPLKIEVVELGLNANCVALVVAGLYVKSDDGAYITLMVHTSGPGSPIYRSPCLTIHVEQHYSTLKTANKRRQLAWQH